MTAEGTPLPSPPLSSLLPCLALPRCRGCPGAGVGWPGRSPQARPGQARPGSTRRPQGGRRQRSAGLRGDEGGTRCPLGALWSHVLRRSSLRSRPRGGEANAGAAARPVPPPPSAPSFTWQVESKVLLGVQTSSAFTLGVGILCS